MKQASITTALVAGVAMFVVYAAPAADDLHFVTKTSRPLREICNTLEERCHWRISFEEPPLPPGDQAKASPTGFIVHARRAYPVSIDVPGKPLDVDGNAVFRQNVIATVLSSHAKNGNPGGIQKMPDGDFVHIVPTTTLGADGRSKPWLLMLETRVSIPKSTYELGVLVDLVLSQISAQRGIRIVQGTVPMNLFVQTRVTEEARDETARSFFVRAFEEVNLYQLSDRAGPRRSPCRTQEPRRRQDRPQLLPSYQPVPRRRRNPRAVHGMAPHRSVGQAGQHDRQRRQGRAREGRGGTPQPRIRRQQWQGPDVRNRRSPRSRSSPRKPGRPQPEGPGLCPPRPGELGFVSC